MKMKNNDSSREIDKYTMEAVFQAQESLRSHLDMLIEEKRALNGVEERDLFMRELTYSTLGLGVKKTFEFRLDGHPYYKLGNVEAVGRWLAYQKEINVIIPETTERPLADPIPVHVLWGILRDHLFYIFPLAIDRACGMSKERDSIQGEKEFNING